jgi:phosphopantetheinyl transferase (holo-ACP synthase)
MAGLSGVVGIGIDAVDVARLREVLRRTPSARSRLFTAGELADANRRPDPAVKRPRGSRPRRPR